MDIGIGIEMGGARLRVGVGDERGALLGFVNQGVDRTGGAASLRKALPGAVEHALGEADVSLDQIRAVGAGFAGTVQANKGVALHSSESAGWGGFPLGRWLEGLYDVPAVVENDANAAGYAEAMVGAGKGISRVFYINVGSSIGGAWVLDGQVDRGQGIGAAEIGHTWVPYPASRAMTELERVASGRAISRRARAALDSGKYSFMSEIAGGSLSRVTARVVYAAAKAGDELARQLLAESCDALAMALGNAINLYQPEQVIVSGGITLSGPLFWSLLREQVMRYVFEPFQESYELAHAALGQRAAVTGALLLALEAARISAS